MKEYMVLLPTSTKGVKRQVLFWHNLNSNMSLRLYYNDYIDLLCGDRKRISHAHEIGCSNKISLSKRLFRFKEKVD